VVDRDGVDQNDPQVVKLTKTAVIKITWMPAFYTEPDDQNDRDAGG